METPEPRHSFPHPIRQPDADSRSVLSLLRHAAARGGLEIGAERKAARWRFLRERWMRQVEPMKGVQLLTSFDPAQACALGAMRIDGLGAQALTDWLLRKHRIHVRPRFVPGEWEGIRVTPNVFTTLAEVDAFGEAIGEASRGAPG